MSAILSGFDSLILGIVDLLPRSWNDFMLALSFVGQPLIAIAILGVIGVYGLRHKKYQYTYASITALLVFGLNSLIKLVVHRQRPSAYTPSNDLLYSYSFPSGHAAGAMLAYGLLAYIVWRKVSNLYVRLLVLIMSGLLIIGIGVSRVYLGNHYPSDVLVGWTVGALGLAIIMWKVKLS